MGKGEGGGGGVSNPKIVKESMKLNWNFLRRGVQSKNPFRGNEVWIFFSE